MAVELMPHQFEAIRNLHPGSILRGGVGTGKSITALVFFYTKICGGMPKMPGIEYRPMTNPKELYVITTAKKRDDLDWEQEAAKLGIGRESNENGIQMHVDSWNNIADYELVEGAFFIFDEQRLVGKGAWVKMFLEIAKKNQWIMLSATPGDNWMDYVPVFVANGFYKNRSEFVRRHVVWNPHTRFPKVQRYTEQFHLSRLRDSLLVEMPYERHTARHVENVLVSYDHELYEIVQKQRWHVFENRPLKDAAEMFALLRKIVNTDPSRVGELLKILEKHPRLIVFYNFNYELEMLRTLTASLGVATAEWNGHKHQPIPDTKSWVYLVQYTAGAEGWNCISTNSIAYWSLNYSWKIFEQSKGRIDRLNTPFTNLYYFVFRSDAPSDQNIWKSLMGKKLFNSKRYAQELWDSYVPF